jgi:hypothetical protein
LDAWRVLAAMLDDLYRFGCTNCYGRVEPLQALGRLATLERARAAVGEVLVGERRPARRALAAEALRPARPDRGLVAALGELVEGDHARAAGAAYETLAAWAAVAGASGLRGRRLPRGAGGRRGGVGVAWQAPSARRGRPSRGASGLRGRCRPRLGARWIAGRPRRCRFSASGRGGRQRERGPAAPSVPRSRRLPAASSALPPVRARNQPTGGPKGGHARRTGRPSVTPRSRRMHPPAARCKGGHSRREPRELFFPPRGGGQARAGPSLSGTSVGGFGDAGDHVLRALRRRERRPGGARGPNA